VGCKDKNEEFYDCSDISVHNEIEIIIDSVETTTKATEIRRKWELAVIFSRSFDLTTLVGQYCQNIVLSLKKRLILYSIIIVYNPVKKLHTVKLPLDRHRREFFQSPT